MSLTDRIDALKRKFETEAAASKDAKAVEELRNTWLSRKKGRVTDLFAELKSVSAEEKPEAGRLANELKMFVQERLVALEEKARKAASGPALPDLTLPGKRKIVGAAHPLTLIQREIEDIFIGMGFTIEDGPEVETDYYNFEALNFPKHHPARDSMDTFYINDDLLLRTQTSPVQIRTMEKKKPPIRIISPGRVFRRETPDPTHLPMFCQVEGLVVDEGVTFANLKGTLEYFVKALFGEKARLRFRPSFFPFTEPSAEVDIECMICGGKDPACRVCGGTGWKEIIGAGMVNPQVFKNVNIDPEKYSGWAFGMGIDRTAMSSYGIPELRYFYENDIRFIRQFSVK